MHTRFDHLADHEAINEIVDLGANTLSADSKNALHACRPGHPLNNEHQWRNAHAVLVAGRYFSGCSECIEYLGRKAEEEAVKK